MLTAMVAHPPRFGGNGGRASTRRRPKKVPGVVDVYPDPHRRGGGGEQHLGRPPGPRRAGGEVGRDARPRSAAPTPSWRDYKDMAAGKAQPTDKSSGRPFDTQGRRRASRRRAGGRRQLRLPLPGARGHGADELRGRSSTAANQADLRLADPRPSTSSTPPRSSATCPAPIEIETLFAGGSLRPARQLPVGLRGRVRAHRQEASAAAGR